MEIDALIHQIAAGSMPALEELYHKLYSGVFAFVLSIVQNSASAADVTQEVFLRVYKGAKNFQSRGHGKAWVMKIAKHLALNECKQKTWEPLENLSEADMRQGDAYSVQDSMLDLRKVFQLLDKREREILMLRAQGYQHNEIAEILRIPQGTIRWKYARVMKKLRAQG